MVDQPAPSEGDIRVDEIRRQLRVLARELWPRIFLTCLAFALSAIFLPLWVSVLAAGINIAGELAGMRLMRGIDPARDLRRYRLSILSVFVMEGSYTAIAGLVWVQELPYAQSFALGMIMITLIHLSTVRAIHLPYGITGFAAVTLAVLVANPVYWIMMDDFQGFLVSTICAIGGLGYALTAMISNNGLHKATAQNAAAAQVADSEKSRFLARMSHELRTPLNAIIGLGLVERDQARDPRSAARLTTLVDSARGLATILDDILDLSAVGAGRFPLRDKDFELRPEIEGICAIFSEEFRSRGMTLSCEVDEALPAWIRLDPQRLRQGLTNLLSNTLRHSDARTVSLTLRKGPPRPEGRPILRILVCDDGRGIPEAERQRLFQPFHQGRDTREGTGLGLAICRAMARQMGGDVVALPVERGTTFQMDLAYTPAQPPPAAIPRAGMPNLAGRSVLIVDDVATNRLVAAAFLQASAARTLEAAGGEDALRLLAEEKVDLVLLDMNMPGMDGFETFRRIRDSPASDHPLPVIAMTADATAYHQRRHLAEGLDDHLSKPIDPEALAQVLRRHLGQPAA